VEHITKLSEEREAIAVELQVENNELKERIDQLTLRLSCQCLVGATINQCISCAFFTVTLMVHIEHSDSFDYDQTSSIVCFRDSIIALFVCLTVTVARYDCD